MRIFLFLLSLVSLILALDENQSIEVNVIDNSKNQSAKTGQENVILYDYVPERMQDLKSTQTPARPRTLAKIIDSRGSGENEQEALNNALINALSQLRGVSGENLRKEVQSVKFKLSSLGQIEQSSNEFLQNVSKGRIDTYKINAINHTQNGVELELSAYKYIFESTQKSKLVLYDLSQTKLSEYLKQAFSDAFSQSQDFQFLQRDGDYEKEEKLFKSEDLSSDELYKLGNVLGADYILEFKILEGQKLSSKIGYGEKLSLNIAYKLVFFPTREVLYSRTLSSKLVLSDDIKKQQKAFEKIAFGFRKELENFLFSRGESTAESTIQNEKEKSTTYKLGEKGGVDLGF